MDTRRACAAQNCAVTIVIDSNSIRPLYNHAANGATFFIQRELELWASTLKHPLLAEFTLHNPTRFLQPHELTALIRTLAKHYTIHPLDQRLHTVNCDCADLTHSWLGLFKGLGFNRCLIEMELTALENTQAVIQKLIDIREFGFANIGVVVYPSPNLPALKAAITPLLKHFSQLHIFVGHSPHNAIDTNFALEPDEDSLIVINLGPGQGVSLYSEHTKKLHDINLYTQALLHNQLPISTPITLPNGRKS